MSSNDAWVLARGGNRASALGAALLLAALGYVALVFNVGVGATGSEQHLGAPVRDVVQQLGVYVEPLNVDPVNAAMRLRVSFAPSRVMRGERLGTPDRALTVRVSDGDSVQELTFPANERMAPITMETDLDGGTIASYPLDRFRTKLRIESYPGLPPLDDAGRLMPVSLTFWTGIAGWIVHVAQEPPGSDAGEVRLRLDIQRTGAQVFFALAVYGVMVLIAGAALTIGSLVFLRERKLEATLAGFLSGMLFALPATRYSLPGAPPLGVRADVLVFLWAELAVALGLLLFIVTWARGGPRE